MQPLRLPRPLPVPAPLRIRPRTILVASSDRHFRQRLRQVLSGLRWQVREAEGGADAWREAENSIPEAVIVDSWLPDLAHDEFLTAFRTTFPDVEILVANGGAPAEGPRSPHRQELLYALRCSQESDAAEPAGLLLPPEASAVRMPESASVLPIRKPVARAMLLEDEVPALDEVLVPAGPIDAALMSARLPELVGNAPSMLEISRRIRLVAPRTTPVLIEGPTGSGKEIVAEALHRLSSRSRKPFVALNCAAIPEALLEAELFGHTRGAFTGAVHGRVGRIEAADGGTLFLDEIGEMPLALQSKLLRFVESGELQRVGDNETVRVDVRILAATHRRLVERTQTNGFRADLYYRLAVFLIRTPALAEHMEDLPPLVSHFLERMGRTAPVKRIDVAALDRLMNHTWPGNVRELEHVLERAAILAGDAPVITAREIDFGGALN